MTGHQQAHPYEMIPLDIAGYILGSALVLGHLIALVNRRQLSDVLVKSPRNHFLAQITLTLAFGWFFLLMAPEGFGIFSKLRVELAEFEKLRFILQLGCPVLLVLMVTYAKELLFPRALGFLGLMVAAPFLTAAYLKEPETRILIPIWCYAVIFISLVFVGKPYVYRDLVNWITAKTCRWNVLCIGGIIYGLAMLACADLWW